MLRSLRARLMLVSAGLSGAVLAVFAAWTYARLYGAGLQEIDAQLRNLGEHFLLKPERDVDWQELDRSLAILARSNTGQSTLMYVLGRNGEPIAQSAYWPEGLAKDEFKAPPPEPRDARGGPRREDFRNGPPPRDGDRPPPPRDDERPPSRDGQDPPRDFRGPPPAGPENFDPLGGGPPPQDGRPSDPRNRPPGGPGGFDPRNGPPPQFGLQPQPRGGGLPGALGGLNSQGSRTPGPGVFDPRDDRPPPRGEFRPGGPPPPRPDDRGPGNGPGAYPPPLRTPAFTSRDLAGGAWRIAEMGAPHATLVAGIRLDSFRGEMANVRTAFLSASGLALLGIVLGAWAVSNQALGPVRRLSRAIEGVSARGLGQRVPEETRDPELRRLTQQFNAMMARLEGSFTQAVRFSADAAHELKTPLSILQGHLEEALRKEPEGSGRQESYSKLLEEVQRLKNIVGKLLLLARADAGQLTLSRAHVNFSQSVEETCEDTRILASSLDISAEIEPGVSLDADDALLRQVLQNMCSNAIKYNMKGGKIRFRLRRKDHTAVFTAWNTGKPVPETDRERIFDRFYRVDTSRARKVGGAGLGLSLAREIARAHGGELTLEPPKDGWVGFRLTLPLPS